MSEQSIATRHTRPTDQTRSWRVTPPSGFAGPWPIIHVAHVGDSRCYLLRDGELRRLTTDHTLKQRLAEVSPEALDDHSRLHHTLWNSLGASQDLPKPEFRS